MKLRIIVEDKKPTVCVDLDGLLATYDKWRGHKHIGKPISGAKEFLEKLSKIASITILTSRCSDKKSASKTIKKWFEDNDLIYDTIWDGPGKPPAVAYIDDRGINCNPQHNKAAFTTALKHLEKLIKLHA